MIPPHFSHSYLSFDCCYMCCSMFPSLAQNPMPRSVDSWLKAEEKGVGNKKEQTEISVSPLLPPITEICRASYSSVALPHLFKCTRQGDTMSGLLAGSYGFPLHHNECRTEQRSVSVQFNSLSVWCPDVPLPKACHC